MRISVVIPSYNHARFLGDAIQSVIAQIRAPDELLVIDDGSTDGSPEVAAQALQHAPFPTRLIVRKNRGLCSALNQGLSETRGDLFAYLGSDDIWMPRKLKIQEEQLSAEPRAVLAYSPKFYVDAQGMVTGRSDTWEKYKGGDLSEDIVRCRSFPPSCTAIYRRSALGDGWDPSHRLEDYPMVLRLSFLGPFAYHPQPLGAWRSHPTNTSSNVDMMHEEILAAQRLILSEMQASPTRVREAEACARFRYGAGLIEAGQRRRAAVETLRGLRGAPSKEAALRRIARLLLPVDRKERVGG